MFTGLIQEKAKILSVSSGKEERRFVICTKGLNDLKFGESICVNGVCLSVEGIKGSCFEVFASSETLSRTNLKFLKPQDEVNIERALQVGDRLGGHIVTGHVDCLSEVKEIKRAGESYRYVLGFPKEFSCFVVEKGSVALDGISLTINRCGDDFLEVNIIPITYKETTISSWRIGTLVNTEFDIIGKYVVRMFEVYEKRKSTSSQTKSSISFEFLKEHGFI